MDSVAVEDVTIDIEFTIVDSLEEIEVIRSGKFPKRSYKDGKKQIKENLKEISSIKKVPRLEVIDGVVLIDDNDLSQAYEGK